MRILMRVINECSSGVVLLLLLFKILHSLNHIQLPPFMLCMVNIAILRPFL